MRNNAPALGLDLDGEVVVLVVAPRDDGTFVVTVM
jgi:hypothetical protein